MPTEIEIIIARITKKLTEAKIAYENEIGRAHV